MNTAQHLSDDVLNAWLDDVLPDVERATLEAHLAQCADCRRTADELAALKAALAALPQAEPPRSFRLTPEQASRPKSALTAVPASPAVRLLPVMRTLSIAAVMALLIVSTALLINQTSDNDASIGGETAQQSSSSLRQEAAAEAESPGEIVDQGEAASSDANAVPDLAAPQEEPAAADADEDDGLSTLAITAIGLGGLSVVLLAAWLALARSGSASVER
jgi:anti-sigma factor RsiW